MTDNFDAMTKEELADFASVRGFEIDGRWSAQRMREAIRSEMAKDAANVTALSEAVNTDMVTMEADDPVAPSAPSPRVEISAPKSPDGLNIDAIVWQWAESFCDRPQRATAVIHGDMISVEITTPHGVTSDVEALSGDDAASVKAALAKIKSRIVGD